MAVRIPQPWDKVRRTRDGKDVGLLKSYTIPDLSGYELPRYHDASGVLDKVMSMVDDVFANIIGHRPQLADRGRLRLLMIETPVTTAQIPIMELFVDDISIGAVHTSFEDGVYRITHRVAS